MSLDVTRNVRRPILRIADAQQDVRPPGPGAGQIVRKPAADDHLHPVIHRADCLLNRLTALRLLTDDEAAIKQRVYQRLADRGFELPARIEPPLQVCWHRDGLGTNRGIPLIVDPSGALLRGVTAEQDGPTDCHRRCRARSTSSFRLDLVR